MTFMARKCWLVGSMFALVAMGSKVLAQSDVAQPVIVEATPENPNPTQLTEIAKPMANRDLGKAKAATSALARRLSEELEDRLLDYMDEFEEELKRVSFSDLERDDLIGKYKKEKLDPMAIDQLDTALINLDSLAVQRVCRKLMLPTAETEALVARIDVTSTFASLKKKVQDGDSALTVSRLARKLQRDVKAVDLPQGRRLALLNLAELVVAGMRIRDAVEGGTMHTLPSGAKVEWPVGQVPVVFYPRIPKSQVFVLGSDCLVAGADPNTDIVFGMKTVPEAMHLPVYLDVAPVPNDNVDSKPPSGVFIHNPDDSGATINYRVVTLKMYQDNVRNKEDVMTGFTSWTVAPGQSNSHPGTDAYVIEFSQGPMRPSDFATLRDGMFEFFVQPDQGWKLRLNTYEVTLDNSDSANDFHYVVDNRRGLVPAGGAKKHTSNYPIVVRFDRGGGTGLVTKVVNKIGAGRVWKIGVNVDTNYWDLFNADDIPLVTQ